MTSRPSTHAPRTLLKETLRRIKRQYPLLMSSIPDVVWASDAEGNTTFISPNVEKVYGFTPQEICEAGTSLWFARIHPDDAARVESEWASLFGGSHGTFDCQYRIRRKDGEWIWLHDRAIAVVEKDGWASAYGIFTDITRVKEDEEVLRRAKEAAESASRFKSDFLASMSHEIRTPMTAILGYADLLLDSSQTHEDRNSCIQIIRQNGSHLLAILNDILDLSKFEAGKLKVERTPCSPAQVVADVTSLLQARAKEKKLDFHVQYYGPIPETVETDPTRLRQILLNLLANAIKFTNEGSVLLCVNLLEPPEPEEPRLCFEVIDTGPGMSLEQKKRLFQAYFQADPSLVRAHGGTGLGLVISKRLAQLLGGDIAVQTWPGEGSSFLVMVDPGPLAGVEMLERPEEIRFPARPAGVSSPVLEPMKLRGRILLAEDVVVNQRLISLHLSRAGLTVDVVSDGRAAADKVLAARDSGAPYDLVLMDMNMPVLDGYAAAGELRRQGYVGPIVALTASALTADREQCLLAGCTEHLAKPIDRVKLIEMAARFTAHA